MEWKGSQSGALAARQARAATRGVSPGPTPHPPRWPVRIPAGSLPGGPGTLLEPAPAMLAVRVEPSHRPMEPR